MDAWTTADVEAALASLEAIASSLATLVAIGMWVVPAMGVSLGFYLTGIWTRKVWSLGGTRA